MDTRGPIVLAGGSGFLGMNLARSLTARGDQVIILSRSEPESGAWTWMQWDGKALGDWATAIDGAHTVVNFSGKSIDCYPTPKNRAIIISSRVDSTRVLGQAIAQATTPPKVWVQMSAVGIYGNTTSPSPESTPPGTGFLPEVCTKWEDAFHESCPDAVRGVLLRAGVVLGRTKGAFPKLVKLARFGLGGAAGKGTQGMSWIHEDDMDAILLRAIDDETMRGTYNATAPHPASNHDFMRSLRKVVSMPFGPPAPAFMIKLAARFLLDTNPDLALEGQFAIPKRLLDDGFEFQHPELHEAQAHLHTK